MKKKCKLEKGFQYQCIPELPCFEYGCMVGKTSQGSQEAEAGREEVLMSSICLISHH